MMQTRTRIRKSLVVLSGHRGVALPMAMLSLLILSALIIGFSVLSASEPTIAKNHLMVAQARAIAEAGVERAIWALNNATHAAGIPVTFTTAPAPYDGGQLVAVTAGGFAVGGFRVTVANGATAYERNITAVGWVPDDTTPRALQKITVTVFNPQLVMRDPPAALSVRGKLHMSGNALVDSRSDTSCGRKAGTLTSGPTSLQGDASNVWGAESSARDADLAIRNQVTDAGNGALPATIHDIVQSVATSLPQGTPGVAFDQFILTDDDLNMLRALAKARGTYLQGTVTFSSSNQLPNGLVFVDTGSGSNITKEGVSPATPSSDFASVDIHDNAGSSAGGSFNGWLVVNGTLSISGDFTTNGFVYVQNDLTYHGTGAGGITGAVLSRNIRDLLPTRIDSDLLGNANITYNCQAAKTGGGTISARWSIKGGTYREVSGS